MSATTQIEKVAFGKLIFRSGPRQGESVTIDAERFRLGRDPDNDISLDHDLVSGRHCVVISEPDGFRLRDLDSKNGTFLNDERIRDARLSDRDRIRLCHGGPVLEFRVTIELEDEADAKRPVSTIAEVPPAVVASETGVRRVVADSLGEMAKYQRRTAVGVGLGICIALSIGFLFVSKSLEQSGSGDSGVVRSGMRSAGTTNGSSVAGRLALDLKPIFSSQFRSYRVTGIGTARIENRSDEPIRKAQLLVDFTREGAGFLAEVMRIDLPEIAPGDTLSVPLRPVFSRKIITDRSLEATVVAQLIVDGGIVEALDRAVTVHDYHAFSWAEPERVSVFVDSNDAAVRAFVDAAWSYRPETGREEFPPRNVVGAATLLSALAERGVRYKPDAETPVSVSAAGDARDRINYPGETLLRSTGDCDDLVVLCCSILEAARIPTAIVEGDSHVLLLFDTGLSVNDESRSSLFSSESCVVRNETIWLPIEATDLARAEGSFEGAWAGAWRRVGAIREERMRVVDVRAGWEKFEPLHRAPSNSILEIINDPETWKLADISSAIAEALEEVRLHARGNLEEGLGRLREDYEGAELAQAEAYLFSSGGMFRDAATVLRRAIFGEKTPDSVAAFESLRQSRWTPAPPFDIAVLLNDLALNVALGYRERVVLERAAAYLEVALSAFPEDLPERAEMMLRLGLIHLQCGNPEEHRRWTCDALAKNPELEATLDAVLLGDGTVATHSSEKTDALRKFFERGLRSSRASSSRTSAPR